MDIEEWSGEEFQGEGRNLGSSPSLEQRESRMDLWIKGHLSWDLEEEHTLVALKGECGIKEFSRQREWHIQWTGGW